MLFFIIKRLFVILLTLLCLSFIVFSLVTIEPNLKKKADYSLSFGKMVWPHSLARVMLAEQIYRSATILLKTPYHRN